MQRNILTGLTRRSGLILLAGLACAGAGAAELGDIAVHTHIGQPLVADIELTSLAADEVTGLQVRLASPDVYRGASIAMNPALESLDIGIVRRNQKQFLHITSLKPIDANYLNLFLALSAGGRHIVRASTIWLTPDPTPLPLPAPPLPLPKPMPPAAEPGPDPAVLAAQARARMPRPARPAAALPATLPLSYRLPPVQPPPPSAKAPPPAACSAPPSGEQSQQCRALDLKNAALAKKLIDLEGKVKVLQQALGTQALDAAVQDRPAPMPVPLHVKPKPLAHAPVANKENAAAAMFNPITLFAGGAALLLLLIGIAVYFFRKRKNEKMPSKYWALLRKPFQRKTLPEPPELLAETGEQDR